MEDLSRYNPEGSDLRKGQLRMLEIAKEFDKICKKNNITYWIISGTLLGARRHGGFIPWDDDFDVGVMRKDYKRVLACLEKELPTNLRLQTRETDPNYLLHFAKIRDLKSVIHEDYTSNYGYKYNGLFVDIFPFEQIVCLNKKWKGAVDCRFNEVKYKLKTGMIWRLISKSVHYLFCFIVFILRFLGMFTKNKLSNGYGTGFYAPHKLSTCFPVSKIKFEDYEFSAPNDVDQYLKNEYGDFMKVPPKDNRIIHSSKINVF